MLALAGLGGSICATGGEDAGGIDGETTGAAVSATSVTDSINYQGGWQTAAAVRLPGRKMTFRLCNVSTGGTALAVDTHTAVVTDGLFNTGVDFDQSYFDGRTLAWGNGRG